MARKIRINFADLKDGLQIKEALKLSTRETEKLVREQIKDMKPREIQNFCEKFFEENNRVKK